MLAVTLITKHSDSLAPQLSFTKKAETKIDWFGLPENASDCNAEGTQMQYQTEACMWLSVLPFTAFICFGCGLSNEQHQTLCRWACNSPCFEGPLFVHFQGHSSWST